MICPDCGREMTIAPASSKFVLQCICGYRSSTQDEGVPIATNESEGDLKDVIALKAEHAKLIDLVRRLVKAYEFAEGDWLEIKAGDWDELYATIEEAREYL